jgi:hypothetical protein
MLEETDFWLEPFLSGIYLPFLGCFLDVFAAALKSAADGAPLEPGFRIRSSEPPLIRARFFAMFDQSPGFIASPLHAIGPIGCRHASFGDVLGVAGLVIGPALLVGLRFTLTWGRAGNPLFAKAKHLYLAILFRKNDVGFLGVIRCSFGFVVPIELFASVLDCH